MNCSRCTSVELGHIPKVPQDDDLGWGDYNASSGTFDGMLGVVERGVSCVYVPASLRRTLDKHESIFAAAYARFLTAACRTGSPTS